MKHVLGTLVIAAGILVWHPSALAQTAQAAEAAKHPGVVKKFDPARNPGNDVRVRRSRRNAPESASSLTSGASGASGVAGWTRSS
jgi:hypothetical protein